MAPRSRCMSGNTCGCRMSGTYRRAVMVPRINTRGDRVLSVMAPHTITPAVGAVCRCKAKAGLRSSHRGLHTRTRLSSLPRFNLGSLVLFRCSPVSSCAALLQTEASMAAHVMGAVIPNILQHT
ncbi:hypothetical protein TNCV_3676021 [Trichonephila clavipes]|nr:hypothetical protein TNCV_3676021 [Trichonephila clavipes]